MHQEELATTIKKTVQELYKIEIDPTVERSALSKHGDYSTSVALALASQLNEPPMEIAEKIAENVKAQSPNVKSMPKFKVGVAEPGFMNFTLTDESLGEGLQEILEKKENFGKLDLGKGKKVNVEFVSANPTGPLHIGNFRGGPLGDTIASVLQKAGFSVTREYYHNDLGEQVRKLGESILYWKKQAVGEEAEFPEGGYEGEYVKELSSKLKAQMSNQCQMSKVELAEWLGRQAVEHFFKEALGVSKKAGIEFDVISKESEIAKSGKTTKALKILDEKGYLKEKDGAVWFAKDDDFLGDRECVVKKSNNDYTYFSNDLGYHLDKHQRGFERVIDVWGANHHGHVTRMKSGMEALGFEANWLTVPLYQWVTIIRSGRPVSMSKRAGNFITAEEVLEEVGSDALRWFFLSRDAKTHIRFDLDLAKEQSKKNPVYYAQYAYARICSVLAKAQKIEAMGFQVGDFTIEERVLIREIIFFPELVAELAKTLEVHKLTLYATNLADKFHKFYENCKVLGDPKEAQRLAILCATEVVLSHTLSLLGVSTPEKM